MWFGLVGRRQSHPKRSWPFGPPRCLKMTRRWPDERLRKTTDCLSRLQGLSLDPMPMPLGRHNLQTLSDSLFEDGPGPGIEPVGGEFQPSFETAHPGGDAYLFTVLHSIFALKRPEDTNSGSAIDRKSDHKTRRHHFFLSRRVTRAQGP